MRVVTSVGPCINPHSLSLKQILVLLSLHIRTRISCYCPFRLQKDQNSWYRGVVWQFLQQNTTQYDNIPHSNASPRPLFENLTDDAIAQLLIICEKRTFSIISLHLTKLYFTLSFTIASSVKYSEIRQNFSNSAIHTVMCQCDSCLKAGPNAANIGGQYWNNRLFLGSLK